MASVEERAKQLLEGRLASVRELVAAAQAVTNLEDQMRVAKGRQLAAFRTAEKAGWAPAELRELGFADPAASPPRRARSGRAAAPKGAPAKPAAPVAEERTTDAEETS